VAGKNYVASAGDAVKPAAKADKSDKAERKSSRKAADTKPQ
jgi:hypothetical protein